MIKTQREIIKQMCTNQKKFNIIFYQWSLITICITSYLNNIQLQQLQSTFYNVYRTYFFPVDDGFLGIVFLQPVLFYYIFILGHFYQIP